MKRFLTSIFILLSAIIIIIGGLSEVYWSGVVSWGLAVVCLLLAAYYTKYIPNEKKKQKIK